MSGLDDESRPAPPITGKRKALLIGINYMHLSQGRLSGCINDVKNVEKFLRTHGYDDITVLTDDNPYALPTKANILEEMKKLVADAQPGDGFFFHYSGHGGQSADHSFLEEDGNNETICPMDYPTNGQIVDDTLHDILCRPLPEGAHLFAIFDSCHSGTVLDLPYLYKDEHNSKYKKAHKAEGSGFLSRHLSGWSLGSFMSVERLAISVGTHVVGEGIHQTKKHVRRQIMEHKNTTKANVLQISGCRDEQTSADTNMGEGSTGAMSYAFIKAMEGALGGIPDTWAELISDMRDILHAGAKKFTQMPQLSCGRPDEDPNGPIMF